MEKEATGLNLEDYFKSYAHSWLNYFSFILKTHQYNYIYNN